MTLERTRTREKPAPPQEAPAPETPGGSDLLQQAAAYGKLAREAREDCEKGALAAKELENRRNASGQ